MRIEGTAVLGCIVGVMIAVVVSYATLGKQDVPQYENGPVFVEVTLADLAQNPNQGDDAAAPEATGAEKAAAAEDEGRHAAEPKEQQATVLKAGIIAPAAEPPAAEPPAVLDDTPELIILPGEEEFVVVEPGAAEDKNRIYQVSFSCPVTYYPGNMVANSGGDNNGITSFTGGQPDMITFTFSYYKYTEEEKAQFAPGKAPERLYISCDSITGLASVSDVLGRWRYPDQDYRRVSFSQEEWEFLGWGTYPDGWIPSAVLNLAGVGQELLEGLNTCEIEKTSPNKLFGDANKFKLYPVVRPKLVVNFVLDGVGSGNYWTGGTTIAVEDKDGLFKVSYVPDPGPSLSIGYMFTGWSEQAGRQWQDEDYTLGRTIVVQHPLTLHACWIAVEDYDKFLKEMEKREWEDEHYLDFQGKTTTPEEDEKLLKDFLGEEPEDDNED